MTEIRIDTRELDRLTEKLAQSPEVIREAKRLAFEQAAPALKAAVDAEIGGTGKVRSWQDQAVGSKGGYAAVRPKSATYTDANGKGKRYAVGYVTNAINSGHAFPPPSGRKGYRSRIKIASQKVPGKQFYQQAEARVPQIAQEAVEQVIEALTEHLEG